MYVYIEVSPVSFTESSTPPERVLHTSSPYVGGRPETSLVPLKKKKASCARRYAFRYCSCRDFCFPGVCANVLVSRKEEFVVGARKYIQRLVGLDCLDIPPRSLREDYEDTTSQTPMIILLSPGVDPSDSLHRLSNEIFMKKKEITGNLHSFHSLSLGKGQTAKASALIQTAR